MSPPPNPIGSAFLARVTPDDRRRRRLVAATASLAAVIALYAAVAVVSGVKSGPIYNLLIAAFAAVTLLAPAFAAAALLAPDAGGPGDRPGDAADGTESDPVTELQRQYATGEIDRGEFDERMEAVLDADRSRTDAGRSVAAASGRDGDTDRDWEHSRR
ncbi:hypothetical protein [Halobaculum rubrum]|uniref:hypothetical protein n=1 Tax=Halobaculum rubrum TaxID=2872158 RepID=UPI001CA3D147|nr:hypothetical protein [Halobaculum rubrum]QZX99733.1 hypothetical protein K6T25_01080 [Halobaculum rubrum]